VAELGAAVAELAALARSAKPVPGAKPPDDADRRLAAELRELESARPASCTHDAGGAARVLGTHADALASLEAKRRLALAARGEADDAAVDDDDDDSWSKFM